MFVSGAITMTLAAALTGGGVLDVKGAPGTTRLEVRTPRVEFDPLHATEISPGESVALGPATVVASRQGSELTAELPRPNLSVAPSVVRRVTRAWRISSSGGNPTVLVEIRDLAGEPGRLTCNSAEKQWSVIAWVQPTTPRRATAADGTQIQEGDVEVRISIADLHAQARCSGRLDIRLAGA